MMMERRPSPPVRSHTARGATLVELLVGSAVFTFLMLASIALIQLGTGGWRAVEGKTDATRQMNVFEADIIQELRRASLASVGIYTPANDYRWAIWMKTPMNSLGCVDAAGKPTRLGEPAVQITKDGEPVMQRYVVYYVTRMDRQRHLDNFGYLCASYASDAGPDTTCPHKWIVKKDVYLLSGKTTGSDAIGLQSGGATTVNRLTGYTHDASVTESALLGESEDASPSSSIARVRIIARNILSFEVTRLGLDPANPMAQPRVRANGPIILFDVKAFKLLSAGDKVRVGNDAGVNVQTEVDADAAGGQMVKVNTAVDATGQASVHTSSAVMSSYGSFTLQLDNRVIPQNP